MTWAAPTREAFPIGGPLEWLWLEKKSPPGLCVLCLPRLQTSVTMARSVIPHGVVCPAMVERDEQREGKREVDSNGRRLYVRQKTKRYPLHTSARKKSH